VTYRDRSACETRQLSDGVNVHAGELNPVDGAITADVTSTHRRLHKSDGPQWLVEVSLHGHAQGE
jgi:hypothetical protein